MIENTSLGHLDFWPLWDVNDKLISVSAVIGHRVIFLDQAKWQDVWYSLGVIPHRIRISREITNFVGACHSCITMDTCISSIRSIYVVWEVFSVDKCVACLMVSEKAQIFIYSGLRCSIHDGIAHVHYAGITLPHTVVDRLVLTGLLSWGLAEHEARRG